MSEGVVNAFLFACVICPIFSSRVILERQSAVDVQALPDGVGVGLEGVAVGGLAAKEFVVVTEAKSIMTMTIGKAILNIARSPDTSLWVLFLEENMISPFGYDFE
jgi:hypothetical protein